MRSGKTLSMEMATELPPAILIVIVIVIVMVIVIASRTIASQTQQPLAIASQTQEVR